MRMPGSSWTRWGLRSDTAWHWGTATSFESWISVEVGPAIGRRVVWAQRQHWQWWTSWIASWIFLPLGYRVPPWATQQARSTSGWSCCLYHRVSREEGTDCELHPGPECRAPQHPRPSDSIFCCILCPTSHLKSTPDKGTGLRCSRSVREAETTWFVTATEEARSTIKKFEWSVRSKWSSHQQLWFFFREACWEISRKSTPAWLW